MTNNWPEKNILNRKGDAGMFKISSPALTAVTHPRKQLGLKAIEMLLDMDNKNYNQIDWLQIDAQHLPFANHRSLRIMLRLGYLKSFVLRD